jgi:hypothetical protein
MVAAGIGQGEKIILDMFPTGLTLDLPATADIE